MRAVRLHEFGDADALRVEEVADPEPGPTEVLVRVHAAGVNPVDAKTRRGEGVASVFADRLPMTPGYDVAGVVEACGPGVTRWRPGDEVVGMLGFPRRAGGYAELAVAPSRRFAHKPGGVSFDAAAGLPLVGLTAWQALFDIGRLPREGRLLMHAAAGGVGHVAVQLARWHGCRHVVGTASSSNHRLLRELGVTDPVDYRDTETLDELDGFDVVVDPVGGETRDRSLQAVRRGGTVIALAGDFDDDHRRSAEERGVRLARMLVEPDRAQMEQLAGLLGDGTLRVVVAETFDLGHAADAHRAIESGRTDGKLVLRP